MKKLIPALLAVIMLLELIPVFAHARDDGFEIGGVNVTPRSGQVTLLTPEFGKPDSTMAGKSSVMEIVVVRDVIKSVDTVGDPIPDDGYIIVLRGSGLISQMKECAPKPGDKAMVTSDGSRFIVLNDSYNPFYTKQISFDGYNRTRTADTIIIYNRGETTGTNIWGSEVVVGADGCVVSVGGNNNAIPDGGFVISAVGKTRIAELSDAAAVGLSVTVDDANKTVTFEYGKSSVINSMRAALNSFCARLDAARSRYDVIDYASCELYESNLESLIESAAAALDDGSLADAMLLQREFELIYREAEASLIVYPAVEARTLWVRPTAKTASQVESEVKKIHEMGFNSICLELMFDCTVIFPVDSEKYGFSQNPSLAGFDLLKAYIDECHRYGIEVHGWMSVYRVGYDSSANAELSVFSKYKDLRCIAASGKDYVHNEYGNGWFLNPARPEVTELLLNFYGYIFDNYDLDGFHLDYVRYPYAEGEMFGYDDYTLNLFENEYGSNPRDLKSGDALWQTWCEFRASFVTNFVRQLRAMMEEKRPDMYLSAAVAPNFTETYKKYMQESAKWLSEGLLDMVFPMAYGTNVVPLYAGYSVEAAGDGALAVIGVSDYGKDVFLRQIDEARAAGAEGIAFFSYSQYLDGRYADTVLEAHFASPSLSPTYNAAAAVAAQLEYILDRLYAISVIDEDALSLDLIDVFFDNISKADKKSITELSAVVDKLMFDLEKSSCPDGVREVLMNDLKKAAKISALSRDEAKADYRKDHPLPEAYGDTSQEGDVSADESSSAGEAASSDVPPVSTDTSEDVSENVSEGVAVCFGEGPWPVVIAVIAVCVIAAAVVVCILLVRRKKK